MTSFLFSVNDSEMKDPSAVGCTVPVTQGKCKCCCSSIAAAFYSVCHIPVFQALCP